MGKIHGKTSVITFLKKKHRRLRVLPVTLLITFIVAFILGSSGCQIGKIPKASIVESRSEDLKIHVYKSPPMDSVNLYWLEADQGIIAIDTGRFISQAKYALSQIRASSNKPIIGILITHPHTDHYGGLPVFKAAAIENVPIYASQATYDDMRTDGQGFIKARNRLHGNDFPDHGEIPLPNRIVKDGEEIQIGGLTFQVIELLKNETIVTTLYYLPKQGTLFAGDFVTNKTIPFLADGNSSNWLVQINTLLKQYPNLKTIYPGHGNPGPAKKLLQAQIAYVQSLRNLLTSALAADGEVTKEEKAGIITEMEKRYPDYEASLLVPGLLNRNVEGIAKEMKQMQAKQQGTTPEIQSAF